MAAQTNGHAKGPKASKGPKMDRQTNGSIHGSDSGKTSRSSRRRKSNRSYTGWLVDKGTKVLIWYTVITVLFRCPSTPAELTDASPAVCKGYFNGRDLITPYAKPYYDQYAAPYVQKAQPYVDRVNEKAYQPALAAYTQHGAPLIGQAQQQASAQWEKTVKPQLAVARQQAGKSYDATLAPHVKKVRNVVQPYYDSVTTSASDIWELEIQPVYRNTAPYAHKLYTQGQHFAVTTVLPQAQYASSAAWSFWARQIWPKMRVLYGENVEPQLMRITERLGRYKDGKKLEAEVKSMESSSSLAESSSSAVSASSSISSFASAAAESPVSAVTAATSESSPESTVAPAEQFKEDLKSWEDVCAKAVDEGAEHLNERIKEIADHQVSSQVNGTGKALVTQLEETSQGTINSVKARILSVVGGIAEDADDARLDEANESLTQGIRNAGQTVKQSAQAIREWRQKYDSQTQELVNKALQSTLETIDSIRELRLTEIGRKYSDKGLVHKEWSKYNDLKKATQVWRDDVEKVTVANADLTKAKEAADEIEQHSMSVAEDTAKELGRLKEVAKWKVAAGDATDDFETKSMPAAAERVRKNVADKVAGASEAVIGSSTPAEGSVESATSVAAEKVSDVSSSASEAVYGSTGSAESLASKASEKVIGSSQPAAESATSKAKESVHSVADQAYAAAGAMGDQVPLKDGASKASTSAESVASAVSESVIGTPSSLTDSATDVLSKASETIIGSETPAASSLSSSASSMSKSLSPKAASILSAGKAKKDAASKSVGSALNEGSSIASSSLSSVASQASDVVPDAETVSSASKKVWGGAMAQVLVEAREPILDDIVDDDATYSERIQSMANAAVDQAGQLTQAVQEALRPATSSQGAVESVTSVASEQYESALSAASSALFGTKAFTSTGSTAAREQYLSAVTA